MESIQRSEVDVELFSQSAMYRVLVQYKLIATIEHIYGDIYGGPSPFRDDSDPTFFVNLATGEWFDVPPPRVNGNAVENSPTGLMYALEGSDSYHINVRHCAATYPLRAELMPDCELKATILEAAENARRWIRDMESSDD